MKRIYVSLGFLVLAACTPLRHTQRHLPMPRTSEFSIHVHPGFPNQPDFTIEETHSRVRLNGELLSEQDARKFKDLKQAILKSSEWRSSAKTPSGTDLPWNGPAHEFWDINSTHPGARIPRSLIPQSWRSRMMSIHAYMGRRFKPSEAPRHPPRPNKTDAGNGSNGIFRVPDTSRSPSPDPQR